MSKTKTLQAKASLQSHDTAKPLHVQRLESAVDIRPFVSQVEKFLNSDVSDSDDDSDKSTPNGTAKGDRYIRGVHTARTGKIPWYLLFNILNNNKIRIFQKNISNVDKKEYII